MSQYEENMFIHAQTKWYTMYLGILVNRHGDVVTIHTGISE